MSTRFADREGHRRRARQDLLGHPDNDDTAGVSWRSCDTAAAAATATRMVRKMNTAMSFKVGWC
ncbi:hypothetical protein FOA52_004428 [Chlamydomonas sp. UWO 241]|nr:hypothetical protein FOA52_004428 [Chlamydomonas sp. UWO 241]